MIGISNRRAGVFLATVGMLGSLSLSIQTVEAKRLAEAPPKTQVSTDDSGVKIQLSELSKALSNGDAHAEAQLWSEEGIFVDDNGKEWKGRQNLEQRFASVMTDTVKKPVEFVADRIRSLSPNVVIAEGLVQEGGNANEQVPPTRFSMLYVKEGNKWMIARAAEHEIAPQAESPLQSLDWLIGDWSTERNGGHLDMKYEWMADKKFIHCKMGMNGTADAEKNEIQIIGFDPRTQQIVSWVFDANGGFGRNVWFKKDKQWLVDATRIGADGTTSKSTHVITPGDANSYSWQSVARTIDGVAVADTAELKVERATK